MLKNGHDWEHEERMHCLASLDIIERASQNERGKFQFGKKGNKTTVKSLRFWWGERKGRCLYQSSRAMMQYYTIQKVNRELG